MGRSLATVSLCAALIVGGCGSSHLSQTHLAQKGNQICRSEHGLLGKLRSHESNVEIAVEWPQLRHGSKLRTLLQEHANRPRVPAFLTAIRAREAAYAGLTSTGMTEHRARRLVRTLEASQAKIEKSFEALGMRACASQTYRAGRA